MQRDELDSRLRAAQQHVEELKREPSSQLDRDAQWSDMLNEVSAMLEQASLIFQEARLQVAARKQPEAALQRERAELQTIFDAVPASIYYKDAHNRFLRVNAAFIDFLGMSEELLLSKPIAEMFPETDAQKYWEDDLQVIQSGQPKEGIIESVETPRGQRWLRVDKLPYRDDDGQTIGVVGFAQDITEQKRVQEALQDSETRFRRAVLDAPFPIMLHAEDGQVVTINRAWSELTGYTQDDLPTTAVWTKRAYGAKHAQALRNMARLYDLEGREDEGEHEIVTQAQKVRIWHFSSSPLGKLSDGRRLVMSAALDVTERKLAERAITQRAEDVAALYAASQVFLAQVDAQMTLDSMCRLAVERLGMRMAWAALVHADDPELRPVTVYGHEDGYLKLIRVTWDDTATGQGPTGRAVRSKQSVVQNQLLADGCFAPWREAALARGYHSSAALPLLYGEEVLGVLSVYCDRVEFFTPERVQVLQSFANLAAVALERARLYDEVQRHAVELEQRVAERTAKLQETNQELESFAYSVSHDLRAPLRAMHGFSQALLEDYGDALGDEGCEYAQRVVSAAQRMDGLIQDLLAYSRLSRTEITLTPISLDTVMDEVLNQLAATIQDKEAQVQIERPLPEVLGHHTTVVQVVANLVSNAVKFVPPGVHPLVRVSAQELDQRVRLWIQDNGIGIAPEHQERIFRVFERLHGVETYPGTGIGLAIVRKGAERMKGCVGVESALGSGSRFWVEFQAIVSEE